MASVLASAVVSLRNEEPRTISVTSADVQSALVAAQADAAGPATDMAIGEEKAQEAAKVSLSDTIGLLKARIGACLNEYIEKYEGGGGNGEEGDAGLWDGEENGEEEEDEGSKRKKKGKRTGGK